MLTLMCAASRTGVVFDLHVPWESPGGPAPGVVSIGIDNVRIGKVEFRLHLLPRKGYWVVRQFGRARLLPSRR